MALSAAGWRPGDIADQLTAEGIPTASGRPWARQTVARVLVQETVSAR